MQRFIGLDVHTQSCTGAVVDGKGKVLRTDVIETNGESLIEYVRLIPGRKHLCIEEGTQSQWISEIMRCHVHELAVVWAEKREGNKSDAIDAIALAQRMRTGSIGSKIFKAPQAFTGLRDLARVYAMATQDVVRTKNRIKSFYRSRGLQTPTKQKVFAPKHRDAALLGFEPVTRQAVKLLCEELDTLEATKQALQKALVAEARKHTITRTLETTPGLGPVRVAQLLATVVSPHRFRTSRQFWSYCGLGIVMRSSADWTQACNGEWVKTESVRTRGLNRNFNRIGKAIFKGAATTVIGCMPDSPLSKDYRRLLERGTKPNLAKVTLARKIAAITLSMWKRKEKYDPEKHRKHIK